MSESITFVTDRKEGEPCLLSGLEREPLSVRDSEGVEIARIEPGQTGWTHDTLTAHAQFEAEGPLDAYLGGSWVGSTEV